MESKLNFFFEMFYNFVMSWLWFGGEYWSCVKLFCVVYGDEVQWDFIGVMLERGDDRNHGVFMIHGVE